MKEKQCNMCEKLLHIENFYTNGKTPKGTQNYKAKCKSCENQHNRLRFIERLISIVGVLECSNCGYSKCIDALEFHHLDGSTKENSVSKMRNYSEASLREEIKKCVLLCANCHREVHAGLLCPNLLTN